MILQKLKVNAETGETARIKINAAIDEVNVNITALADVGFILDRKVDVDTLMTVVKNTFSGTTAPDPALGKNGDIYYQFPTESVYTIFDGGSYDKYMNLFFYVMKTTTPGLEHIVVEPGRREIELMYDDTMPHMDTVLMEVGGGSYPLTIVSDSAGIMVASYDAAADTAIQAVLPTTPFKFTSKKMTGKYKEYMKNNDIWVPYQVFSRETIVYPLSNVPTRPEMKAAFELIPYHNYSKDLDFYVEDTAKSRMTLIKYRANGDTTGAGTNHVFWSVDMMKTGRQSLGGFKAPRASMRLTGQWNVHLTKDSWTVFDFDGGTKGKVTQDRRMAVTNKGEFGVPEDGTYILKIGLQTEMKDNHGIEMVPMIDGVPYSSEPIIDMVSDTWGTGVKAVSSLYWESQMVLNAGQVVTFAVKSYYNNTHNVHFQRIMYSLQQD